MVLGMDPILWFRVDAIHDTWIEGTEQLGQQQVKGNLHLDHPMIIAKDPVTGEPLVTLTLRRIEPGTAFLQVSTSPSMEVSRCQ